MPPEGKVHRFEETEGFKAGWVRGFYECTPTKPLSEEERQGYVAGLAERRAASRLGRPLAGRWDA